jgi:glyoxylase-like metal-dependent hydrolase (beta-lactamase superfamily II)
LTIQSILPGLYCIPTGQVNAFLLEDENDLVLIDTGNLGSEATILAALAEIQRKPTDIQAILLTHLHPDHTGSLGALKQICRARAWMHPQDAAQIRLGAYRRAYHPAPGLFPWLIYNLFIKNSRASFPALEIEEELSDQQLLPFAGGLQVIHAPGHTAGHVLFYWKQQGGVLIAADLITNSFGLGWAPIYEDFQQNLISLEKVTRLDFSCAVFSHGKPLLQNAAIFMRSFYDLQKRKTV